MLKEDSYGTRFDLHLKLRFKSRLVAKSEEISRKMKYHNDIDI